RAGRTANLAFEASITCHLLGMGNAEPERVNAFVGPTGSGKTTTIAKLAAREAGGGSVRIGLVMADTYRVGAEEQLGAYARRLGIPMRIARDRAELEAAFDAFADRDRVYVDTAGIGGDGASAEELRALLADPGEPIGVTAVVSAATSERALRSAWRQLQY